MERRAAAAVIVGNEILTAKVVDENGPHLVQRLRDLGIPLASIAVVPDEVDSIVEAVGWAHRRARHVFTSGGIGPTHDDVTVRAVALALGRPVVRLPEMVQRIVDHYGDATPAALRMAEAPEGAELWAQEGTWFPVLTCDGVYMLPGVPSLFRHQLETVLKRLPFTRVYLKSMYLRAREAEIAAALDGVALSMPHVAIGSYPNFDQALDYTVKVTVEHAEADPVEQALARLYRALKAEWIVRVD